MTTATLPVWPGRSGDVTADGYARWLTATAFLRHVVDVPRLLTQWQNAGLPRGGAERDAYTAAVCAASAEYGLVFLLREQAGLNSVPAAPVQWVHDAYDGQIEAVVDRLAGWLVGYGIDPALLVELEAEVAR